MEDILEGIVEAKAETKVKGKGVDMSTDDKPMLTVKNISNRLGMSISFVYQELSSGRLEHYQLGKVKGRIRISQEQLDRYLETFLKGNRKPATKPKAVELPTPVNRMSSDLNSIFNSKRAKAAA